MLKERQPEFPVGPAKHAKKGSLVVVLERRSTSTPFDVEIIRKEKTSQPGNPKVIARRTSDKSLVYLGGGTSVLG